MRKTSSSICASSFACALQKMNDILGPDRLWIPNPDPSTPMSVRAYQNQARTAYVTITDGGRRDMTNIEGITGKASLDHEELNADLREFGVDIQFEPFRPTEFGTIGLYEVGRSWVIEGMKIPDLRLKDNTTVPGFRSSGGYEVVVGLDSNPTVKLYTERDDRHIVIMCDDGEYDGFELHEQAVRMEEESQNGEPIVCGGVQVPMVDLNQQPDISRLIGLTTHKDDNPLDRFHISQALQQNIFQMDHLGFLAKSATALAARRSTAMRKPPPPDFIVDGPFIAAVVADYGVEFVAHVWPDTMRDPKRG